VYSSAAYGLHLDNIGDEYDANLPQALTGRQSVLMPMGCWSMQNPEILVV
jgi:hypothetical protein